MGLGATPTFLVGYLGPVLREDLDLQATQLGLLVGLFYGATGLVSLVAAPVVERLGPRRCVAGDLLVVALGLAASAATRELWVLAAASTVAGAAYAFANAGTSVAVTAVSRRDQAGTAVAVKTAGIPATASVLALAALPTAGLVGWRGVAAVLAGLAALTAVVALLVVPRTRPARLRVPGVPVTARRLPPRFGWVPAAAALYVVGNQPLTFWLVLSLTDGGVSRPVAGLVSAAGTGAGAVAMVLTARRGDRIGPQRRAVTAARAGTVTLAGVLAVWAGTHVGLVLLAVGAVGGLVGAMVGAGLAHAVAIDRAPESVGRATALMSAGYYLAALVSPLLFGALADLTGSYDASWAATATSMALCVGCYLLVQRLVPVPQPASDTASSQLPPASSSLR